MKIFGMGLPELILILAVVLIIFGPKNLPKLGGMLGRTVKKIRGRVEDDDAPASGKQTAQARSLGIKRGKRPSKLRLRGPFGLARAKANTPFSPPQPVAILISHFSA